MKSGARISFFHDDLIKKEPNNDDGFVDIKLDKIEKTLSNLHKIL
jgi:hypothetical protein